MQMCAKLCQGASSGLTEVVRQLSYDAFSTFSQVGERRDALLWAENYKFPRDIHERDEQRIIKAHGDFASMVTSLQADQRPSRFSRERIRALVPETDPDYEYLLTLADGMAIYPLPTFQQRSKPMGIRRLYSELQAPIINKLLYKQWSSEKCFIFEQALQIVYSRVPTRLPSRLRRVVVGHRGRGLRPTLRVPSSVGGYTGTVPERVQFR